MSALPRSEPVILPLDAGDTLTRDEFHRRYLAHPEIHKAELIEGVVYVPSPVSAFHSSPHNSANVWLGVYAGYHPTCEAHDNLTVRFEGENEVQPDALLRIAKDGTSLLGIDGYLYGPPELALEISASSATYDLHAKKDLYCRAGVREYIVWRTFDRRIDWFVLQSRMYVAKELGLDGMFESVQFPGLRLPVQAMLDGDMPAILAAISPEPPAPR